MAPLPYSSRDFRPPLESPSAVELSVRKRPFNTTNIESHGSPLSAMYSPASTCIQSNDISRRNIEGETHRFAPSPTVSIISRRECISARGYFDTTYSNVIAGIFNSNAPSVACTVIKLASFVKHENSPTQFPGAAEKSGLKGLFESCSSNDERLEDTLLLRAAFF